MRNSSYSFTEVSRDRCPEGPETPEQAKARRDQIGALIALGVGVFVYFVGFMAIFALILNGGLPK